MILSDRKRKMRKITPSNMTHLLNEITIMPQRMCRKSLNKLSNTHKLYFFPPNALVILKR